MITYGKFKELYESLFPNEDITIVFKNKKEKYIIVKYDNGVTFQRIGQNPSGEIRFNTIDELYINRTIDEIILREEWTNIVDIIFDGVFSVVYDKEDIKEIYKIEV